MGKHSFTSKFKNYLINRDGQVAITTALLGIPILLAVGYSIDQTRSVRATSNMMAALDTAALASVLPAELTVSEREAYAKEVFDKNYFGEVPVTLSVKATRERVDITGEASVDTAFGGIVGVGSTRIVDKTAAELTRSEIICVLALDPKGEKAIEFLDDTKFRAPACSVQSNSNHPRAINSEVLTSPVAQSFCAVGGTQGDFFPYSKGGCSHVIDPYANLEIMPPAESCDQKQNIVINGPNTGNQDVALRESQMAVSYDGESIIPDNATLKPGIYCRGVKISGANIKLDPGLYHVWGDLEFTQFASVTGKDVTFILKGQGNRLLIEKGSQVDLKAPSTGLTAGLVFWQEHLNFWRYVSGRSTAAPTGVTAVSEINSGAGMRIVGTAYLPNHELIIDSDSPIASQSPATSFIAYRLKFAGKTNMTVNVDHEAGGIPPILPRADDSARLVR